MKLLTTSDVVNAARLWNFHLDKSMYYRRIVEDLNRACDEDDQDDRTD